MVRIGEWLLRLESLLLHSMEDEVITPEMPLEDMLEEEAALASEEADVAEEEVA